MSDIDEMNVGLKWYVAHTYSGYENKVKTSLEKIVENRGLGNLIYDIKIPVETVIEKDGDKEKTEERAANPSSRQLTRFDDAFLRKIIQEIENNIQNSDFKIEDLADTQHISRTVFYRKIKSLTGSSPIELVQEIRIRKAIEYLREGEWRVSEIAYRCGFSSPQYFSRVFKERTGQSPTEYKSGKNG